MYSKQVSESFAQTEARLLKKQLGRGLREEEGKVLRKDGSWFGL